MTATYVIPGILVMTSLEDGGVVERPVEAMVQTIVILASDGFDDCAPREPLERDGWAVMDDGEVIAVNMERLAVGVEVVNDRRVEEAKQALADARTAAQRMVAMVKAGLPVQS